MKQTLIIENELTDLNNYIDAERRNKYAAAKIKKNETNYVAWSASKLEPFEKPVYISFKWVSKNRRKDKDNIAFAKKFILDGLVKAGVLKNDGYNNIIGFKDGFEVDKNSRIEVTLDDGGD